MDKVNDLRSNLEENNKAAMVVSEPDEVAWLFNLRGEGSSTIDSLMISPLFQSLALITRDSVKLWIHLEKVDDEIKKHLIPENCTLNDMCVEVNDYSSGINDLQLWARAQEMV